MSTGEKSLSFTLKVADNGALGGNNLFTIRGDNFADFKENLKAAFGEDFVAVFSVNLAEAGETVAATAVKGAFPGASGQPEPAATPAPAPAAQTPSNPATAKQKEWVGKKYPGQYDLATLTFDDAKVLLDKAFAK